MAKKATKVKKSEDLKFDENSIKKRIEGMLKEIGELKDAGGVMEVDDEEYNGEDSDSNQDIERDDEEQAEKEEEADQEDADKEVDDNEEEEDEEKGTEKKGKREKREKKKFDFERNSRTIFVGNLPNTLDHKAVAKMFKVCGPVETARIRSIVPEKEKLSPKVAMITGRIHSKVNSVNAYVVFKSNENNQCLEKALKMNGRIVDGHHIRVDRAQRPRAKKETLTSRKKSIFVGNLRFDLRDDELINHFSKAGNVNYVRLVRDRATGLGKGFGFVEFQERASVKKALELNETQFKGRSLRVKKVQE